MGILSEVFLPSMVLLALGFAWHSALGARERARAHARRLCRAAHLQLLDETVALRRLRLGRRGDGRLQIEREYRFEVSRNGRDRLPAGLRLAGEELSGWFLPPPLEAAEDGGVPPT